MRGIELPLLRGEGRDRREEGYEGVEDTKRELEKDKSTQHRNQDSELSVVFYLYEWSVWSR